MTRFKFIEHLDDGAFGDVWRARDRQLDRDVAIKIVREAAATVACALNHARALARVHHPNVVTVYSVESVTDPTSGDTADGVVMELLEGVTLEKRLEGSRFTLAEARRLCDGLLDGVEAIHEVGLAHSDLHEGNVMVSEGNAKIIDILYRNTLALMSTASRAPRLKSDRTNLRILILNILGHSEIDPSRLSALNGAMELDASVDSLRQLVEKSSEQVAPETIDQQVGNIYRRVLDDGYPDGQEFAEALDEITPDVVVKPLLLRMIDEKIVRERHIPYVKRLWARASSSDKIVILQKLSEAIDQETPKGRWAPLLRTLQAFGRGGWEGLPNICRIRLEKMILNDILAGRKNAYGNSLRNSGSLGTWANVFWHRFSSRDALVENIAGMLKGNWDSQNYIGDNFLPLLSKIADSPERKKAILEGLRAAIRDDAFTVKANLSKLPEDWVEQVGRRE